MGNARARSTHKYTNWVVKGCKRWICICVPWTSTVSLLLNLGKLGGLFKILAVFGSPLWMPPAFGFFRTFGCCHIWRLQQTPAWIYFRDLNWHAYFIPWYLCCNFTFATFGERHLIPMMCPTEWQYVRLRVLVMVRSWNLMSLQTPTRQTPGGKTWNIRGLKSIDIS